MEKGERVRYRLAIIGLLNIGLYAGEFDESLKSCKQNNPKVCSLVAKAYLNGNGVKADPKKASKYFEMACDIDVYEFCAKAGFLYLQGNGVTKDMKKAISFNQKACDGGVGFSCMTLGVMAYRGDGMKQDKEKAISLFKQACELGDENGCNKYKALQ